MIQYRLSRGLTQSMMAGKLGVSPAAYSRWENGKRRPAARVMPKIVEETGGAVTPNDFYGLPEAGEEAA